MPRIGAGRHGARMEIWTVDHFGTGSLSATSIVCDESSFGSRDVEINTGSRTSDGTVSPVTGTVSVAGSATGTAILSGTGTATGAGMGSGTETEIGAGIGIDETATVSWIGTGSETWSAVHPVCRGSGAASLPVCPLTEQPAPAVPGARGSVPLRAQ